MDKKSFRTVQSVGRQQLIDELMEHNLVEHESVIYSAGDDAAVTKPNDGYQLTSSESFMEGVDFDLTYVPLHHLGYKIGTAAVSDIYAMNGTPQTILVDLAVPNKLSVDMLKEIYRGLGTAGKEYGFQIVGGDLTASHKVLGVSISCYGSVNSDDILYRKGAHTGEAICVTGELGAAAAGLRILMREKKFWEEQEDQKQDFQPDFEEYEFVVKQQLVPTARKDLIQAIDDSGIKPTAMIDLTQGLVEEIKHLAEASGTGAYFYETALPIGLETRKVADEMKEDVDKYALYGGEDFELLFTISKDKLDRLGDKFEDITVIGQIKPQKEGLAMERADGDVAVFNDEEKGE